MLTNKRWNMNNNKKSLKGQYISEYAALKNAIDRCTRDNHPQFKDYGGRGIEVAPEFVGPNGFENFFHEVGPKADPLLTLERLQNDLGYVPGNLAWATRAEQQKTCRPRATKVGDLGWGVLRYRKLDCRGRIVVALSPLIKMGNKLQTLQDWSAELGLAPATIRQRIQRGWPVEQALSSTLFNPRGKPRTN